MSNEYSWDAKKSNKPTPMTTEEAPSVSHKLPMVSEIMEGVDGVPKTDEAYERAKQHAREGYVRGKKQVEEKRAVNKSR